MQIRPLLAAACWAVLAPHAAAANPSSPPPGDYRIDSEATTTSQAGPMTLQSVQRTNGATGDVTVTQSAPGGPPVTRQYKGAAPNHWCVKAGGAPPPAMRPCANRSYVAGPGSSALQADCAGVQIGDAWQSLGGGVWRRTFESRPGGGAAAPAPSATVAAMAPVIAEMEAQARTASPQEAAEIRDQLARLKAQLGGSPPANGPQVSVKETWTRIADQCAR